MSQRFFFRSERSRRRFSERYHRVLSFTFAAIAALVVMYGALMFSGALRL